MENPNPKYQKFGKTFIQFAISASVLITLLVLVIQLSFIRNESLAALEKRIDTSAEKLTYSLSMSLDKRNRQELQSILQSTLDSEHFAEIVVTINNGANAEREIVSLSNQARSGPNKTVMLYSFPHTGGMVDLEISAYEPWFSRHMLRKLSLNALSIIIGLAALASAFWFYLKRSLFSPIYHIADYLGSRTTENISSPMSLDRNLKGHKKIDALDRVIIAIEKMRATFVKDVEEKQHIEHALIEEQEEKLEIQRLIEDAKAANRAKSEFIATMSHEIRTPLNGVVGMVEMLKGSPLNDNQKHYLDVLYRSGESLLEIINDILDYSKIESGRMLLEKISFDLEELIDNCFKLFGATASKREIELISNIAPDTPTKLIGDPTRLRQILVNLVGNAFKFTSEGFVVLKVHAESSLNEQNITLLFSITDSGIGVSQKDQDHLFEAFRQADRSTTRKFGGSGLGLANCKHVAEQMDGEIGIESEQGKGSTFWFTANFAADEKAIYSAPPSCSLGLSNKKLLAINFSEQLIKGLKQHAPSWNLHVDTLDTRESSIEQHLKGKNRFFEFILIDHQANDGEGFEIANAIRNMDRYHSSPLLMISNQQPSAFSQIELYTVSSIVPRPIAIQNLKNILIAQCYGTQLNPLIPVEAPKPSHAELSVLVAEDNAVNRMVIEGLLGKFEIHPEFAENGVEAVEMFFNPAKNYDLILMDCEMPELDGFDATTKIRQEEKNRAINSTPIIALTAHVEASHRQRVFDCGMNHFLSKPVTIDKLSEALNSVGLSN